MSDLRCPDGCDREPRWARAGTCGACGVFGWLTACALHREKLAVTVLVCSCGARMEMPPPVLAYTVFRDRYLTSPAGADDLGHRERLALDHMLECVTRDIPDLDDIRVEALKPIPGMLPRRRRSAVREEELVAVGFAALAIAAVIIIVLTVSGVITW